MARVQEVCACIMPVSDTVSQKEGGLCERFESGPNDQSLASFCVPLMNATPHLSVRFKWYSL